MEMTRRLTLVTYTLLLIAICANIGFTLYRIDRQKAQTAQVVTGTAAIANLQRQIVATQQQILAERAK